MKVINYVLAVLLVAIMCFACTSGIKEKVVKAEEGRLDYDHYNVEFNDIYVFEYHKKGRDFLVFVSDGIESGGIFVIELEDSGTEDSSSVENTSGNEQDRYSYR